jgi:hypothetical protein
MSQTITDTTSALVVSDVVSSDGVDTDGGVLSFTGGEG